MNKYIFTMRYDRSGFAIIPSMDCFHEIKNFPSHLNEVSFKVARRIDPTFFKEHDTVFEMMQLRMRYSNDSTMHLVSTQQDMTRTELEEHINNLHELEQLEDFLKESEL